MFINALTFPFFSLLWAEEDYMGEKSKKMRTYFETCLSLAMGMIELLLVPVIFVLSRIKMFQ